MAKRKKKSSKPAAETQAAPKSEPAGSTKSAANAARELFSRIGDGIKAAGQSAERYAKVGIGVAEIEKLRLELRLAQSKLGEAVVKCWDEAPDIGVTSSDQAVKKQFGEVKSLRRKIRELESKVAGLRGVDSTV